MSRLDKRQRERARRQRKAERRASQQGGAGIGTGSQRGPHGDLSAPIRGALAPVIDESLRWHMARTTPLLGALGRKRLDEALMKDDVRAYRPRASEIVVRRGRRVVRHVPLLIRTLIVGVRDAAHLDTVARLPGIAEIVSHPEIEGGSAGNVPGTVLKPARLEPKALQRFLVALAAGEIVKPVGIGAGSHVVVLVGPFANFPGIVEAVLPNDRVRVAVAIFGRPSPVLLGIADVQAV